jgi:hypothetical protein
MFLFSPYHEMEYHDRTTTHDTNETAHISAFRAYNCILYFPLYLVFEEQKSISVELLGGM